MERGQADEARKRMGKWETKFTPESGKLGITTNFNGKMVQIKETDMLDESPDKPKCCDRISKKVIVLKNPVCCKHHHLESDAWRGEKLDQF